MIYEKQQGYYLDPDVLNRAGNSEDGRFQETRYQVPMEEANLVSSEIPGSSDEHRPVLDIDLPAELIPSSTPDRFHLYIDCPMTWNQYEQLLLVLKQVGILETNYVNASLERKATMLRKPGVFKPNKEEEPF